jgi:hypothetical protein
MNLEDERKLKFDRRLEGHQDWITGDELKNELEQLPDAATKVYDPEEEETVSPAAPDAAPAEAAPAGFASSS